MNIIVVMAVKKYTYFIGIDISRNQLDMAVMESRNLLFHRQIDNHPTAIKEFITELKNLPKFAYTKTVFCMEHTGVYGNHLLTALQRVKTNIVIEASTHIKNSLGNIRGKSDKIDSIRIAEYAYRSREHLRLWVQKRPVIQQLHELNTLRERMMGLKIAIKTPLKEDASFLKKRSVTLSYGLCAKSIVALEGDLLSIEKLIDELIAKDERLKHLMQLITSVAAIGRVTAIMMIICTNEFRNISDPKKFACYAGVAPFVRESGMFKGRAKVSPMANKKMKSLLHMCALSARTRLPDLKAFYLRKTIDEGKSKMSVINAVRYKLILRVFACVNQDRFYEKGYVRPVCAEQ
ncbi:MAG: transposase [Mucilaginibacter sp.]|uniref:transposase n=1 Tax=Mucilaginibacter sp. TaxID=1882438 RepID=UPI003262F133